MVDSVTVTLSDWSSPKHVKKSLTTNIQTKEKMKEESASFSEWFPWGRLDCLLLWLVLLITLTDTPQYTHTLVVKQRWNDLKPSFGTLTKAATLSTSIRFGPVQSCMFDPQICRPANTIQAQFTFFKAREGKWKQVSYLTEFCTTNKHVLIFHNLLYSIHLALQNRIHNNRCVTCPATWCTPSTGKAEEILL